MLVQRKHLSVAWRMKSDDIGWAEHEGLPTIDNGPGRAKLYQLADVLEFFGANQHRAFAHCFKREMALSDVTKLIRCIMEDVSAQAIAGGQFTVQGAIQELFSGAVPNYPDPKTAHQISVAFKNQVDANKREQERKRDARELVAKQDMMDSINSVANLYEQQFGDNLFRDMESVQDEIAGSIVTGDFYVFIREFMAKRHDAVVIEINRIEEAATI